jgi:hypothetical protein
MPDITIIIFPLILLILTFVVVAIVQSFRLYIFDRRARNYYATRQLTGSVQNSLFQLSMAEPKLFDARGWYESSAILDQARKEADALQTYCGFSFQTLETQHTAGISFRFDVRRPDHWHVMQCVPQSGELDEWVTLKDTAYTNAGMWIASPDQSERYKGVQDSIGIDPYIRLLGSGLRRDVEFVQLLKSHFLKLSFVGPFDDPVLKLPSELMATDPQTRDCIDVFINCKNLNLQKINRVTTFRSMHLADDGEVPDEEMPGILKLCSCTVFLEHDQDISIVAPEWVNASQDETGQLRIVETQVFHMPFH